MFLQYSAKSTACILCCVLKCYASDQILKRNKKKSSHQSHLFSLICCYPPFYIALVYPWHNLIEFCRFMSGQVQLTFGTLYKDLNSYSYVQNLMSFFKPLSQKKAYFRSCNSYKQIKSGPVMLKPSKTPANLNKINHFKFSPSSEIFILLKLFVISLSTNFSLIRAVVLMTQLMYPLYQYSQISVS